MNRKMLLVLLFIAVDTCQAASPSLSNFQDDPLINLYDSSKNVRGEHVVKLLMTISSTFRSDPKWEETVDEVESAASQSRLLQPIAKNLSCSLTQEVLFISLLHFLSHPEMSYASACSATQEYLQDLMVNVSKIPEILQQMNALAVHAGLTEIFKVMHHSRLMM
jgi:hypothetical protein